MSSHVELLLLLHRGTYSRHGLPCLQAFATVKDCVATAGGKAGASEARQTPASCCQCQRASIPTCVCGIRL